MSAEEDKEADVDAIVNAMAEELEIFSRKTSMLLNQLAAHLIVVALLFALGAATVLVFKQLTKNESVFRSTGPEVEVIYDTRNGVSYFSTDKKTWQVALGKDGLPLVGGIE